MNNIKIFSAYIKDFETPKDKNIFIPVHAGKKISNISLDMLGDDTGDNISAKNPNYCELTVLYWAWKNYNLSDVDYVGLSHYRRYFDIDENFKKNIAKYDIIMPKKESMGQYVSMQQNYIVPHIQEDYFIMLNILREKYPDYINSSKILSKVYLPYFLNKTYSFNMFIMKKSIFYEYCEWLFNILFECEKNIKISGYPNQARVFGYLGERLINVFIEKKKREGLKVLDIKLIKKYKQVNTFLPNILSLLKRNTEK